MNRAIIAGRLTRDPEVRYTDGANGQTAIARYTIAVDRPRKNGQQNGADFIPCVAFGRSGEFAEKYLRQGMKMIIAGHIQTGSYKNKDGQTVYTTDLIVDEQEFAESKGSGDSAPAQKKPVEDANGFMVIEDGLDDSGLPWN